MNNNTRIDYMHPIGPSMFNRMYDAHIDDRDQEKATSFCVAAVNDHPNNISSYQQKYFNEHHIGFGKSAPTDPYSDPFLPEKFKKMLADS